MGHPRPVAGWHQLARLVIIDVLEQEHAVTHRELEARAADRTWNPMVCPSPINPHHLTAAVAELIKEQLVESTTARTRGGPNSAGLEVHMWTRT